MNTLVKPHQVRIVEKNETVSVADAKCVVIGDQIKFDTDVWDGLAREGCQKIHYDLLLLCAAVEYADRKWKRPQTWSRPLRLTIPVLNLAVWQRPAVKESLKDVLDFLTCDSWEFEFIEAKNENPCRFKQLRLYYGGTESFVLAYSEGLDSRAVSGLESHQDGLRLRVASSKQKQSVLESFFTQIPFKVVKIDGDESSFRSRGFQFATVTAIAAHLRKLTRIVVPESGQGALGPAMLPLHRQYPDYRNHPAFFRKMELFIKALLDHEVNYDQPRLWSTKGQTLQAFLALPKSSKHKLTSSRSCWQRRHIVNSGGLKQCGLCAACLLRRMSMHTAGIVEDSSNYVIHDLKAKDVHDAMHDISAENDQNNMIEYGIVGARHFQHLADLARKNDDELRVFVVDLAEATKLSQDLVLTNLKTLLMAHAAEWHAFISAQGKDSFLQNWLDGGR